MKLRFVNLATLGLTTVAMMAPVAWGQSTDQTFVRDAASGGMAEVQLGKLAQQNGSNSAVKDFGKRMEQDHSKADQGLKKAASESNITVPSNLDKSDQDTYDRLAKLNGEQFDKAYAEEMVKDHEKDIFAFKKEASDGKDPEIKQFASQTLPTLEDHLKMAQQMQSSVKGERQSSNAANRSR